MKVTSNKDGWNRLKRSLLTQQQKEVRVGWFPEHVYGPDNDNLQMAQVAAWNEGGIEGSWKPNGGWFDGTFTPPRPFMRVWYPEELKQSGDAKLAFQTIALSAFKQVDVGGALNPAGAVFSNLLQQTMVKLNTPPNSEATIELKGFDDPLIETGQLVSSVDYKVVVKKRGE